MYLDCTGTESDRDYSKLDEAKQRILAIVSAIDDHFKEEIVTWLSNLSVDKCKYYILML